jgi:hypothetical protein
MLRRILRLAALGTCCVCPLRATLLTFEDFTAPVLPVGWTTSVPSGYSISFPGGAAAFSRSSGAGDGFAQLSYGTTVSGDFFAVAVVPNTYALVNGGSMALAASWSGSGSFLDAYVRQDNGSTQAAAFNSRTAENPWASWTGDAVLVVFRTGNNIQAGVMSGVPQTGGLPDFSSFSPLGSWTGSAYLGDVNLFLSFGVNGGSSGAAAASVDIFALAVPPYAELIPPGGSDIPEPATTALTALGLAGLLLIGRKRGSEVLK